MEEYEVFHPPNYFVPPRTVPNHHHTAFHVVGGGVTLHPDARIQRAIDEDRLRELSETKAYIERQIGGLQQRLGELNRQLQALTARHPRLDS